MADNNIQFMVGKIQINEKPGNVGVLFKEGIHAGENRDQLLNYNYIKKYVDTFKDGRRDSKAWTEAADFLETYFDESNRVVIK